MAKEPKKRPTPLGIRMSDDLREWVKEQAEKEDRSMNYFIVNLLKSKRKETAA